MHVSPARPNPWLPYNTAGMKGALRLFCFSFAGGGASAYRGWSRDLSPRIDVCPVQYPGRETRLSERAFTSLEPLVSAAADALAPVLDAPYALFGHSMGALVAFELAREFHRRGARRPEHVLLSGFRAPTLPYLSALPHDLPTDEFVHRVKAMQGTPQEALDSPELMELILPILRADCTVVDHYRLADRRPLSVPLTVLGGVNDPEAGEDALRPWRSLAAAGFALHMFAGGHFFVQSARCEVLSCIDATLKPHLG